MTATKTALSSRESADLSPGGQLVFPYAPGQLGLDGAAYAAPLSGEAANRSLGTPPEVSTRTADPPENASRGGRNQLPLALPELAGAPQVEMHDRLKQGMWRVLQGVHERGCRCERCRYDRDARCLRVRYSPQARVHGRRAEWAAWSVEGQIVKCRQWTCPVCGPRRARETASKLGVAFDRHRRGNVLHDVWMLSLSIPHRASDATENVVDALYAASNALWRTVAWRRFAKRWGIVARVRVLDATHGGSHGSHPHFHIALFPTAASFAIAETARAPDDLEGVFPFQPLTGADEKTRERLLRELACGLVPAWEECVREAGVTIDDAASFRRVGLKLSPSEKASRYFTKWGLAQEIGAPTSKDRNHLRLLDAYVAGSIRAGEVYRTWRHATAGHQWVSGLEDMCQRLGVTDEDAQAFATALREKREAETAKEGKPVKKVRALKIEIRPHLFSAAINLGWTEVFAFCDEVDARDGDVQTELDAWLWSKLSERDRDAHRRQLLEESLKNPPSARSRGEDRHAMDGPPARSDS